MTYLVEFKERGEEGSHSIRPRSTLSVLSCGDVVLAIVLFVERNRKGYLTWNHWEG